MGQSTLCGQNELLGVGKLVKQSLLGSREASLLRAFSGIIH